MPERTIYVLYDVREPEHWRYIGQTKNKDVRFKLHRSDRTAGIPAEHLAMATIEVVEAEQADEVERYWIARCVLQGHNLANRDSHPELIAGRGKKAYNPSTKSSH